METRTLGRTGLSVSVLGFGGAEIGFEGATEKQAQGLIEAVLTSGVTLIDTAAGYLGSQKLIGKGLHGSRHHVTLVTKCGQLDGFTREDWTRSGIAATVEESLRDLGTDYVDVLLLHSCDLAELKRGEAIEAIEALRDAGKTRYVGYSGDGAEARWALESGLFDVLETSVNIVDQQALDLLLPLAAELNIGVIAKRPIANAVWRHASLPSNSYHHEYWNRFQKLNFGASEALAEQALRFTLTAPQVSCAIVGTTRVERIAQNATVVKKGPLSADEFQAFRNQWGAVSDATWVGQA